MVILIKYKLKINENVEFENEFNIRNKQINQMKNKIKIVKKDTIKELVYTNNRNFSIPPKWKNKKDAETFQELGEDKIFTNYISNAIKKNECNEEIHHKIKHNEKIDLDVINSYLTTSNRAYSYLNTHDSGIYTINSNTSRNKERLFSPKSKLYCTSKPLDKENILKRLFSCRMREVYPESCKIKPTKTRQSANYNLILPTFEDKSPNKKPFVTFLKVSPPKLEFFSNNYNETFKKKIEINDKKVKTLYRELKSGPYSTHCQSCNRKNLEYFNALQSNTAITLLNLAKQNKKF